VSEPRHRCSQQGCAVEVDGKCMEGLTPEECTFYRAMEEADQDAAPRTRKEKPDTDSIAFHDGNYLSEHSSRPLTRQRLTRVVVLAGEVASGKTTLLASLNDAFQKAPFAGYQFAGSLTLPAFERICHQARLASGRDTPITERTKPTPDVQFLHLRVKAEQRPEPRRDVLLADISGERLEQLRDSDAIAKQLTVFQRADHIVLLFDGGKLSDPESRQGAKTNGMMLLRSCIDSGLISSRSFVDVVFSKWDRIEALGESINAKQFVSRIRTEIEERFGTDIGRLRFFEMAARPDVGSELPFAYGISSMFQGWVEESPVGLPPRTPHTALSSISREFSKYRFVPSSGGAA